MNKQQITNLQPNKKNSTMSRWAKLFNTLETIYIMIYIWKLFRTELADPWTTGNKTTSVHWLLKLTGYTTANENCSLKSLAGIFCMLTERAAEAYHQPEILKGAVLWSISIYNCPNLYHIQAEIICDFLENVDPSEF